MPKWKSEYPVDLEEIEDRLHMITTSWRASQGEKRLHADFLELPSGNLLFHGPETRSLP